MIVFWDPDLSDRRAVVELLARHGAAVGVGTARELSSLAMSVRIDLVVARVRGPVVEAIPALVWVREAQPRCRILALVSERGDRLVLANNGSAHRVEAAPRDPRQTAALALTIASPDGVGLGQPRRAGPDAAGATGLH